MPGGGERRRETVSSNEYFPYPPPPRTIVCRTNACTHVVHNAHFPPANICNSLVQYVHDRTFGSLLAYYVVLSANAL